MCATGYIQEGHFSRNGMDASQLYFNVSGSLVECRAKKLLNLRIFPDPVTEKPWEKSITDLGLEILCVSQVSTSFDHVAANLYSLIVYLMSCPQRQ